MLRVGNTLTWIRYQLCLTTFGWGEYQKYIQNPGLCWHWAQGYPAEYQLPQGQSIPEKAGGVEIKQEVHQQDQSGHHCNCAFIQDDEVIEV